MQAGLGEGESAVRSGGGEAPVGQQRAAAEDIPWQVQLLSCRHRGALRCAFGPLAQLAPGAKRWRL